MTNKTDNYGNLSVLDMFFTRIAKNQFVTHRFSREYRVVLTLVALFDVAAITISIFAGYFYLYSILFKLVNNVLAAQIFTVTCLLLLEFLVHVALSKFFKFLIKEKMQIAFIALVGVTMFWLASFHISTNGLSMRQSKKVSKVESIKSNYELEKQNLQNYRDAQIKDIQTLQNDIKTNPTRWKNGSLSLLSSQQLTDIKELQNRISELKQQYRTDLIELEKQTNKDYAADRLNTQNEAEKYYNFVVIIMIIELLASGFLMFSWSQILKQNKNEDFVNSKVNDIANEIDKGVTDLFKSRFNTLTNGLHLALESHNNNSIPFEYSNSPTPDNKRTSDLLQDAEIINKSDLGFRMTNNNNNNNTENMNTTNAKQEVYPDPNQKPEKVENPIPIKHKPPKLKTCKFCGSDISHKKHWNAQYCNQDCKQKAWEKRTGQKLKLKKKKE